MSVSQRLVETHQRLFKEATEHALTKQWCDGTLDDKTIYVYLAQDLQFFQHGLRMTCKMTSLAPDEHSLVTLAKKIGFFANDENNYFQKCLSLLAGGLDSKAAEHYKTSQIPAVQKYIALLDRLVAQDYSYAKLVTVCYCMELVYIQWPKANPVNDDLHWKYQTWIDLHAGEHFETWCQFLQEEVDKCDFDEVSEIFGEVLQHEYEFFDSCYHEGRS
ncbi:LAMI_0E06546g1_1 [Lachancea mirantina]|uniref:LAMI_0E06546g1_1 n=1 Tax=Lachancea mirantina TaxID=1230905 RepID=A0A1G4JLW1_9SACH|nr:LAMI_0E06546g1_1 [Lachancea mirantina]